MSKKMVRGTTSKKRVFSDEITLQKLVGDDFVSIATQDSNLAMRILKKAMDKNGFLVGADNAKARTAYIENAMEQIQNQYTQGYGAK